MGIHWKPVKVYLCVREQRWQGVGLQDKVLNTSCLNQDRVRQIKYIPETDTMEKMLCTLYGKKINRGRVSLYSHRVRRRELSAANARSETKGGIQSCKWELKLIWDEIKYRDSSSSKGTESSLANVWISLEAGSAVQAMAKEYACVEREQPVEQQNGNPKPSSFFGGIRSWEYPNTAQNIHPCSSSDVS